MESDERFGASSYDDYCVEGAIKYKWNDDRQALTFDNDGWYSSDFNNMLWLLSEFDQRDPHTMNSIHEILQDFSIMEKEVRKELVDTYDDGDTWADGALNRTSMSATSFMPFAATSIMRWPTCCA